MYRKIAPTDPLLESLLDQRDTLMVQISLARSDGPADELLIRRLRQSLSEIESRIKSLGRRP